MKSFRVSFYLILLTIVFGCSKDQYSKNKLILLPISEDIALGKQLRDQILANPQEYPILNENQYPEAYNYIHDITNNILNSGKIKYKEEFAWEVRIIHDDETLNAFAAPGGYIFVYTGLIKYLEDEYELAGVMGHEIAHADRRHSMEQLQKNLGVNLLLSVALGENQAMIGQVLQGLLSLKFSRSDESEADYFSVEYLCGTKYKSDGAAGFFEKIGKSSTPEFLSTHPSPENRVEDIKSTANEKNCSGDVTTGRYEAIKASLP